MAALLLKCSCSRGWVYKWWCKLAKTLTAEGTRGRECRAERETEETGRREEEGNKEWKKERWEWLFLDVSVCCATTDIQLKIQTLIHFGTCSSFSLWSTVSVFYRVQRGMFARFQWMLVYLLQSDENKQIKHNLKGRRNTAKITAASSELIGVLQPC